MAAANSSLSESIVRDALQTRDGEASTQRTDRTALGQIGHGLNGIPAIKVGRPKIHHPRNKQIRNTLSTTPTLWP
jgi:hypothetical protein